MSFSLEDKFNNLNPQETVQCALTVWRETIYSNSFLNIAFPRSDNCVCVWSSVSNDNEVLLKAGKDSYFLYCVVEYLTCNFVPVTRGPGTRSVTVATL